MKSRGSIYIFGAVLALVGIAVCVSLLLSFLPGAGLSAYARAPGSFLFRSFHFASFFIPLYFWACAFLLLKTPFRLDRLILLNYLILPFLTLSISMRLFTDFETAKSPVTAFFARSFSGTGGTILTALLVLLELTVVPRLSSRLRRHFYRDEKTPLLPPPESTAEKTETETQKQRVYLPLLETGSLLANRPHRTPDLSDTHISETPRNTAHDEVPATQPVESPLIPPLEAKEEEELFVKFTHGKMIELAPLKGIFAEDEIPLADIDAADDDDDEDEDIEQDVYDDVYDDEYDNDTIETGEESRDGLEEDIEDSPGEDEDIEAALEAVEEPSAANSPEEKLPKAPRSKKNKWKKYHVPVEGILSEYAGVKYWEIDWETRQSGDLLKGTLEEFKIKAEVVGIRKGPVITMFEILPEPGVKLSKISNLADNIALRLAASSVRIVAPIPGKHAVGIEIPNKNRAIVSFAELINAEKFFTKKMEIPLAIGKDITGEAQIIDLVDTPHLLIAGTTGSGKSVCVNSIICSILYNRSPEDVKLILIDPKIVELKFYNDVPHLLTKVITEPKKAYQALQYAISEMEQRYALLNQVGARDIRSFNHRIKAEKLATTPLPYIVIIIDEFADLMATTGKELESTLARLAAMSRAVGIHLILATQRPSIDVITGLIKANIPSRIAFKVAGKFDSRIIIDAVGAEKLLGQGDMLFVPVKNPVPARLQGAYLAEDEVERVVAYVKTLGEPEYIDDEIFIDEENEEDYFEEDGEDPLMDQAIEIVSSAGKASASYLQRRLKIGYNRAARMVEAMERRGIVGPQDGSKARRVISGIE
ncbi:MAG: DNA translocase FtsK [Spirochaetales bacterium]|jgi:S-DNA-T family DNA segregation ATPase FtsK/SpoIIIE|nr:DNA translocase FtsK [Spirochaetales bacterium]